MPPEIVDHEQEQEELAAEVKCVLDTWLQEAGGSIVCDKSLALASKASDREEEGEKEVVEERESTGQGKPEAQTPALVCHNTFGGGRLHLSSSQARPSPPLHPDAKASPPSRPPPGYPQGGGVSTRGLSAETVLPDGRLLP